MLRNSLGTSVVTWGSPAVLALLKVVVLELYQAKDCQRRRFLGPACKDSDSGGLGPENLPSN